MRWIICSVGRPSLAFARDGTAEYLHRLQRYTPVELIHTREAGRDTNSAQLLKRSEGTLRVALDERGQPLSTSDLVETIDRWELQSIKSVSLLIGGADGHNDSLRTAAGHIWSLSALTLQHELALVLLLEALYRAYTIKRGEPYHRA